LKKPACPEKLGVDNFDLQFDWRIAPDGNSGVTSRAL